VTGVATSRLPVVPRWNGERFRRFRALAADENTNHKALLDRIVAMLPKLGQRGYAVHEDRVEYTGEIDPDTDSDPDTDGKSEKADRQPEAGGYRR
jgi:hypothetical protein